MKPNCVATLNAGRFELVFRYIKNCGARTFSVFLLVVTSCTKSDDIATFDKGFFIDIETPVDEGSIVIYTDIEPDFINKTPGNTFNLDLNNDGTVDFILKSNSNDLFLLMDSNPTGVNGIAAASGPFDAYILPLNKNTVISKAGDYYALSGIMMLGLGFQIKGQKHYGWARLQVVSTAQWVVKDYAYNAMPEKYILAGQK